MKYFRLLLFFCLFAAVLPAKAAEITDLRIERGGAGEHIALQLNQKTRFKVFRIEVSPPRVVVDLENTRMGIKAAVPKNYRGRLVKGVRFGFHDETTGRFVLDLTADAWPSDIRLTSAANDDSYWLEFDLSSERRDEKTALSKRAPKPVIIVDAGHGGQDPGTEGHAGTWEKDITLRYALALEQALLKTGRYRVALTRRDDRYLLLRDRVKRARAAHGDLFISLHADSAPSREASGLSVYTISEKASDAESEALAAQANKADVIGGMDLSDASEDVAGILIDLAERETRAKSAEFAELAVGNLGREVELLSNTHRFAGFAVLKAPDIPSVLIELGFLTNAREERQIKSRSYEVRIVRSIAQAIDDYFTQRK